MQLRIVAGTHKSRLVTMPDNVRECRPTAQRNRIALCEILKHKIPDACAADLCAGSGTVGFELLSRGAASVCFVEFDRRTMHALRQNALALNLADQCTFISLDVTRFAIGEPPGRYDILFYDPPYGNQQLMDIVPALCLLLNGSGVLVVEQGDRRALVPVVEGYAVEARQYGDTVMYFITKKNQE